MRWLAAVCIALLPTGASAQHWRPGERILITAFNDVGAITRDQRRLFIASPGAISIYDFTARRWEPPLTLEDGVPPFDLPTAAEYEAVLGEVWVGTRGGLIYRYRAVPFRVEVVTAGLGPIQALVALARLDDFVYARTATGWYRIRRSAFSAQSIAAPPPEVAQAAATRMTLDPALKAFGATLGLDRNGQRWPLSGFASDERADRYWFGTRGGGVFHFDALRQLSEWQWYGTASEGVPAIAATAGHVWFAGDGRGLRFGVTRATHDLQGWEFHDALSGAPRAVNELAARGEDVWAASRDGVFSYDGKRWRSLAVDNALSVAVGVAGVWASTRTEVFELSGERPRSIVRAPSVERVRLVRDSLWILADRAILRYRPGDLLWVKSEDPPVTERLIDVAARGDSTFLLTSGALHVHDGQRWSAPQAWVATAGLGRLRRLTVTPAAIWVAGDRGAVRLSAQKTETMRVPQDIPAGPVYEVLEVGAYAWFATPAGALRVERRK